MSIESLKSLFDWAAVALILLTFVVGAGALITGNVISARQEAKLKQFDKDLTDARAALKTQEGLVEGLKGDNLKLEAQIAPRRLTREQEVKIADNCTRIKDKFTGKRVRVVSYALDTEGFVFSEQIVSALRWSGMAVDDDSMSIIPGGKLVMGIQVFGSDPNLAKKIADAIGSSGSPIAVSFVETDPTAGAIKIEYGAPARQATILVGLKPPDKDTVDALKKAMSHK
jgi:hypothetical protein